ncbi:hypothetical protein chiPu_0002814 [Chiloscyllium punctatum]|uniref:Ig-like domain-containing protein n=1 Tax=Chiloscyllium punctatum TaxID=137246 RepID=A0A401S1Y2_CHIPU|nr:hypothetical protein [Chiloscyllium punctatum]
MYRNYGSSTQMTLTTICKRWSEVQYSALPPGGARVRDGGSSPRRRLVAVHSHGRHRLVGPLDGAAAERPRFLRRVVLSPWRRGRWGRRGSPVSGSRRRGEGEGRWGPGLEVGGEVGYPHSEPVQELQGKAEVKSERRRWRKRLPGIIHPMSGFEIYAKSEMIVENGTDVRLSCTFKSNKVDQRTLSVYWSFKPGTGGKDQLILYYLAGQSKSQFPDRIAWDGNINKSDVSIIIKNIDFKDNGTYTCQVINPFDYSKTAAEILLSVVEQGSLPKHSIIAGAVIGAVVGLLLIIGIVYFIKRKKDGQRNAYIRDP